MRSLRYHERSRSGWETNVSTWQVCLEPIPWAYGINYELNILVYTAFTNVRQASETLYKNSACSSMLVVPLEVCTALYPAVAK